MKRKSPKRRTDTKRKKLLPVTRATIVKLQKQIVQLDAALAALREQHRRTDMRAQYCDERAILDEFARKLAPLAEQLANMISKRIAGPFPLVRRNGPRAAT